jgi:hypothetical protein
MKVPGSSEDLAWLDQLEIAFMMRPKLTRRLQASGRLLPLFSEAAGAQVLALLRGTVCNPDPDTIQTRTALHKSASCGFLKCAFLCFCSG